MRLRQNWRNYSFKPHPTMTGRFRKYLLGASIVVVVVSLLLVETIVKQSFRFWFQSPAVDTPIVTYIIEEGATLSSVARGLEAADLISSSFWFKFYTFLDGSTRDIKIGDFDLQPHMSYSSIIDIITDLQGSDISITIPEGYTLAKIGDVVISKFDITQEEWNTAVGQYSPLEDHEFVVYAQKPDDVDLEGYLFPDTYRFFSNATAEDIVERMLDEMADKVGEPNLDSGQTMHEVLTLASIIEREVMDKAEMAVIADIFLKRLEIGMALQSDATINYIINGDNPAPSFEDLEVESLYNTYKYAGLPPGPISNPGIIAIEAVLNPTQNNYYYFLTTDEGEVIYAETFDQHIKNKGIYLK